MINIEIINAIISAGTSISVVILSQILIGYKEKNRLQESEMGRLLKEYLNPVRFILAENYYRINKIVNETKKNGNNYAILVVDEKVEQLNKTTEWFVGDGCYLMTSCYLLSCLFAYHGKDS
jgi:putative N-acetylmannosamine-6-phosphate epimerase